MASQRVARVAEEVRAAAADILRGLKDPGIGFATVVRAEMSPDLRYAKIFVSVLGPEADRAATMAALSRATGHVRSELGQRIRLYRTPEVRFVLDGSIAHGDRIARVLRTLAAERGGAADPDPDAGSGSRPSGSEAARRPEGAAIRSPAGAGVPAERGRTASPGPGDAPHGEGR